MSKKLSLLLALMMVQGAAYGAPVKSKVYGGGVLAANTSDTTSSQGDESDYEGSDEANDAGGQASDDSGQDVYPRNKMSDLPQSEMSDNSDSGDQKKDDIDPSDLQGLGLFDAAGNPVYGEDDSQNSSEDTENPEDGGDHQTNPGDESGE